MAFRHVLILLAAAACEKAATESSAPPSTTDRDPAQCTRDDDCVLLPSVLTCCVECPPAPPFEAAPAAVLDGMLVENETVCADGRSCARIPCERIPEPCVARAACVDGRCVAQSSGCD